MIMRSRRKRNDIDKMRSRKERMIEREWERVAERRTEGCKGTYEDKDG